MRNTVRLALLTSIVLAACDNTVVIDSPVQQSSEGSSAAQVSSVTNTPIDQYTNTPSSSVRPNPTPTPNPPSVRLSMPFASQAPTGSWDPPYDEACEEASLIIVRHFLESMPLDAGIMDKEIHAMVDYEESIGLPIDIDMFELARVAQEMFGYETQVLEGADVSIERIEQEIAAGNPVIVPLAGQDIGNPYYSGDGPPYHVLVIVGYNDNHFTTHDVGTKRGENYVYRKEVIMDAIHDWNGSVDTIRSGPRRLLIVTK